MESAAFKAKKRMLIQENKSRCTCCNKGDYAIAAEWFERVADDPERRTFIKGDGAVCFINSTELRRISGACACDGIVDTADASWNLGRLAEFRG